MYKQGDEIHLDEQEVTGAHKTGAMRWVLGVSLFFAIIAMSLVWIVPALAR